jgi:excisionase family DNA binding protein
MCSDHEPAEAEMEQVEANLPVSKPSSALADPLWTVEDVADYLKLQPETIRSMARRGELPALKIGKVWRFQRHAIHALLVSMY